MHARGHGWARPVDGRFSPSACADANVAVATTLTTQAPYLTLPATWENYLGTLTKKKRKSLNHALRDFHAWAGPEWRLDFAQTPEQVEHGMGVLADLHGQRWQAAGHSGRLRRRAFATFTPATLTTRLAQGQLLLLWLTVRGAARPATPH